MKIELDIPVSDESLDDAARQDLQRALLQVAVLRLFHDRRISSAEAASKLGLNRLDFMELTRSQGYSTLDYSPRDLAEDLADLDKL